MFDPRLSRYKKPEEPNNMFYGNFQSSKPVRRIDSFTFFDEVDVLALRLGELYNHVDAFVIVEADETFTGAKKSLNFKENLSKYQPYLDKIAYKPIKLPPCGAWDREAFSRKKLAEAVLELNPPDNATVTYSDCDEIPSPFALDEYHADMGLRNLKQLTFYYNFNTLVNYGRREWSRARIGSAKDLRDLGREFRGFHDLDIDFPGIEFGGWHCGYFGSSLSRIRNKVDSFSHDDMANFLHGRNDIQLAKDIAEKRDLFSREGLHVFQHMTSDDSRLPKFFLENRERFALFTEDYFKTVHEKLL